MLPNMQSVGPNDNGGGAPAPHSAPGRRGAPDVPARPALLNGKVGQVVEKLESTVAQQQK